MCSIIFIGIIILAIYLSGRNSSLMQTKIEKEIDKEIISTKELSLNFAKFDYKKMYYEIIADITQQLINFNLHYIKLSYLGRPSLFSMLLGLFDPAYRSLGCDPYISFKLENNNLKILFNYGTIAIDLKNNILNIKLLQEQDGKSDYEMELEHELDFERLSDLQKKDLIEIYLVYFKGRSLIDIDAKYTPLKIKLRNGITSRLECYKRKATLLNIECPKI